MTPGDIAKQTALSTIKGAISAIPFVGGAINEYAFEARGRIKQERVNSFIYEFADYLGQFKDIKLNIEQIQKPEFGDFFEEVIINVSKNYSKTKKEAFRNILANQLLTPRDIDYAELLLEIISNLQEKQIPILKNISDAFSPTYFTDKEELEIQLGELKYREQQLNTDFNSGKAGFVGGENTYKEILDDTMKGIKKLKDQIENMERPFKSQTYNTSISEFYFLIKDLCGKGLLIDNGIKFKTEIYEQLEISQIGKDLIAALSDSASS